MPGNLKSALNRAVSLLLVPCLLTDSGLAVCLKNSHAIRTIPTLITAQAIPAALTHFRSLARGADWREIRREARIVRKNQPPEVDRLSSTAPGGLSVHEAEFGFSFTPEDIQAIGFELL